MQVIGRDAAAIPQPWTRDNDTTLTGLPAHTVVRLQLQAANAAGDSVPGDIVELTLN